MYISILCTAGVTPGVPSARRRATNRLCGGAIHAGGWRGSKRTGGGVARTSKYQLLANQSLTKLTDISG